MLPDLKWSIRNLGCHWWTFPSVLKIPRWSLDQSVSNPQLSLRVRSYTDKESVLSTFDPDYTFWRKWCTKVALKKPLLLCNVIHDRSHNVDMKKDVFFPTGEFINPSNTKKTNKHNQLSKSWIPCLCKFCYNYLPRGVSTVKWYLYEFIKRNNKRHGF